MPTVEFSKDGAIGVITVDFPPVNALSHALRTGLLGALALALDDAQVQIIVMRCNGRTFMAGADISEFGKPLEAPNLPEVVNAIEACAKPVIAVLHGSVLGGGLEVALGCHYRIALASTQLGLPEIKLGLIPGAGGTQRLPRAIGAKAALEAILSGSPMSAAQALKLHLLDRLVDTDLDTQAIAYAHELLQAQAPARRLSEVTLEPADSATWLAQALQDVQRHPSGPVAPIAAIDAIEAALTLPFTDGLKREGELFMTCYRSSYAHALWHVFFAERTAGKVPDLGREIVPVAIARVAVIGAGTMGRGIALACLNAGLEVSLIDSDPESLKRAVAEIETTWDTAVTRGKLNAAIASARREKLHPSTSDDALSHTDLVIEAVFESMAIKRQVFSKLDQLCAPGTVLATNTSTLNVDEIAAITSRPQDVIGLHFFSPAHVMRLLEVVRAERTSKQVLATAFAFAKAIGKVAVQARVCFGFIGNRMIEVYLEEALQMLLEGAQPQIVDHALESYGLAMGPFAMADLAGLDVGYRIRRERKLSPEQQRLFRLPDALVELGRLGQKSGLGFYRYAPGTRKALPDSDVDALIARIANELAVVAVAHTVESIRERLMLRLINEGAEILNEGIALRASDIDTIYVFGYGFPAWRGGPMYLAQSQGFAYTVGRLQALAISHGERFKPANWLIEQAALSPVAVG